MQLPDETRGLELIGLIIEKDRKAFEALYFMYANPLAGYLSKMLRHHELVDEAINDVMLTIWQKAERYDAEKGRLSTWLFGIAHNKGLKVLEKAGRVAHRETSTVEVDQVGGNEDPVYWEPAAVAADPETELMGQQLGTDLVWAIQELSWEHRCVIELCFKNGLSYQEIADVMGCPENTVKTRMFHARKRLSELLQSRGHSLIDLIGGK